jgi:hypothetical protein
MKGRRVEADRATIPNSHLHRFTRFNAGDKTSLCALIPCVIEGDK